MIHQLPHTSAGFDVAYTAIRDTEWFAEPANPVNQQRGLIRKGDIIWFHPRHFGSGPVWQQARLQNNRMGYVQLHNFSKLVARAA